MENNNRGYEINSKDPKARKTALALSEAEFSGNLIPNAWYQTIGRETKRGYKADLLAIAILAEIVYWYRPIVIRTDQGIILRKKYKGDHLQKDYVDLAKKFCVGRRAVYDAVRFLEDLGIIDRYFQDVFYNTYYKHDAIHIVLNVDVLERFTNPKNVEIFEKNHDDFIIPAPEPTTVFSLGIPANEAIATEDNDEEGYKKIYHDRT